jgi:hypothetical protein
MSQKRVLDRLKVCVLCAGALGSLFACGGSPTPPAPTAAVNQPTQQSPVLTLTQQPSPDGPKDAPAAMQILFQVDVYSISVPLGTFSRNEEFWRRIDEQGIDFGTHDLLLKNGVRVGTAPMSEFEHLRKYVDDNTLVKKQSVTATIANDLSIPVKQGLPEQTIMYFDGENQPIGRSYDASDNLLNLSFMATPRKPGFMRLSLCPMVRADRRRLEFKYTRVNDFDTLESEIRYSNPEYNYDLHLSADIAPDNFFIAAPADEARDHTSVGWAFFMKNGQTQPMEQVLVVIPHPVKVELAPMK